MEDQILELTRQVTILNERLPNHIIWTERNVLDHEKRLRLVEQKLWVIAGSAGVLGAVIATLANNMLGA
jgi:hypothetical protein